jgi:23S rRNA (cytidine2498-2'-O)-methyltransferase
MLLRCQPGFEPWLVQEIAALGLSPEEQGGGWMRLPASARMDPQAMEQLCFAQAILLDPLELSGESVNSIADKIAQHFLTSARTERFEGPWPFLVETAAGFDGLGRRSDAVERAVHEILKKRMSRVAKLAFSEKPKGIGPVRGLFLYFADFGRVFVSRECVFGGQRRMADDPLAPSRSYLKIEEAYGILGQEPKADETVVDLGAAPGGWSYSAAKRGARVIAVDNGPLKGGALDNPLIEHLREDAFHFKPAADQTFDWMFCDLVEEPHHVLESLIEPWIVGGWCRRYVVMLKFGRVDPIALLREIRAPNHWMQKHSRGMRIRHLYHDREEFTIVGEVAP